MQPLVPFICLIFFFSCTVTFSIPPSSPSPLCLIPSGLCLFIHSVSHFLFSPPSPPLLNSFYFHLPSLSLFLACY